MFCSTIIPTVGRKSLSRAVESVLAQDVLSSEFEIIVVNDSGETLPYAEWQLCQQVQVINTFQRERSVARNTGAAVARGKYLHFLDDDDWLAPGALKHLWNLSQNCSAAWLYGETQLVDRQHHPLIHLRHRLSGTCFVQVMAGEWIPLQSSLIDAQMFFEVGGFNPHLSGPEDIDLLRRVALVSELAETPNLVATVVRGDEGSTTDYDQHAQTSRWAREQILEAPGTFAAMFSSANNPSWQGRIFRVYLTSMVWNIRHRRLFSATQRLLLALATLIASRSGTLSRGFWQALSRPYESETFKKGLEEAARQMR